MLLSDPLRVEVVGSDTWTGAAGSAIALLSDSWGSIIELDLGGT